MNLEKEGMQIPVQIFFHNIDPSFSMEAAIRERTMKLGRFSANISSCRVTVEALHKHHAKGKTYRVVVNVRVPGGEVVASRDPGQDHAHEDVYVAIRDAFKAAGRQLQDFIRVRRRKVKRHESQHHGRVYTMHPDMDFGRITMPDGREVYFHRNSVLNADFDALQPGTDVRFDQEQGDQGPRATSVQLIGKQHLVG